MMTSLRRHL